MDIEEVSVPLPNAPAVRLAPNITLQPPLTRRGHGPGLILVLDEYLTSEKLQSTLDPSPRQKWAEEGYAVLEIIVKKLDGARNSDEISEDLKSGLNTLQRLTECDVKDKFGVIVYSMDPSKQLLTAIESNNLVVGTIFYGSPASLATEPILVHEASGKTPAKVSTGNSILYRYPGVSPLFVIPDHEHFCSNSAAVSHTRSLTFLKEHIGGPKFDIEAIWEEHTAFEFDNRSVANTMGTMVQEPYVNHVPTMTGGIGRESLSKFYRYHFIWSNPEDTNLELVSRTIGIDRIVDEFIFSFTHEKEIDWLLPGLPPTGKRVRVPFTSVVNVRGDRLYHEHIAWDQTTVLIQLGLMPEYLTFPYALPGGKLPSRGKRFEYRVPAAGVETAEKLVDETSVPSNGMFDFKVREVDDISGLTNS